MPSGETYIKLASQTLTSNSTTVTFSNIPQNYTDLILVFNGKGGNSASAAFYYRLNGDTGSNYSATTLKADGSTTVSERWSNISYLYALGNGFTNESTIITHFNNYSNTLCNKTALVRWSSLSSYIAATVGLWRNTSAINTILIDAFSPYVFNSGSTFTLYGIAASSTPKAIGGTITTDGTYWIHTFTSSGSFTPTESIAEVDYLVLAGGGGGAAGGGGAGGLRSTVTATGGGGTLENKTSVLKSANYVVTVGAGGSGKNSYSGGAATMAGDNGSDSVFGSITSLGGGGGGSAGTNSAPYVAKNGGCGGGASYSSGTANRGLGTAGQGYDGGQDTIDASPYPGPGGGGTGQAGQNPVNTTTAGAGGNGTSVAISGSSVTYGGGGGGSLYGGGTNGAGGSGGGGAGGGNAGTVNRGGGGGGNVNNSVGGNGSSGIVIVRYPR